MNAVVEMKPGALATQQQGRMAVSEIIGHVALVQEVMRAVMKRDVHYGTIPGTPKPTLYKAGAEVLCMTFRIADTYEVEDLSTPDMIRYRVNCIGTHQTTGVVLGSGLGEASSSEEKYKWRKAICMEEFEATPANLRRKKYSKSKGGGFYLQDQVRTEPSDMANTVLKMANKRAKVAMTINVTACGDMFSQDLEDMDEAMRDHLTRHEDEMPAGQADAKTLPAYPDDKIAANIKEWATAIKDGKAKSADQIVAFIKSKNTLTADQEKRIRDGCAQPLKTSDLPPNTTVLAVDPFDITVETVRAALNKAQHADELDIAASLIASLPKAAHADLNKLYDELHAKLNPQE